MPTQCKLDPAIAGAASSGDWRLPFTPLFRNGDLQTVVGRYWPVRLELSRWPTHKRTFRTEPDVQVLACVNGPDDARATILAVHGLTANSNAPYMRSLAQSALEAGFRVVRLNVRNCGGTEHLAPTLYHSGLTVDLRHVVEELSPAPVFLIGFSMGGNMVLKLIGEWGDCPPRHVRGACAVSAPIRLGVCARRIGERRNRIYELRFLRALRRTMLLKQRLMPEVFSSFRLDGIDSIYAFDDRITAPSFGFRSADHYYASASAASFLPFIRVPTLLIQAEDDPFIPFEVFQEAKTTVGGHFHLQAKRHGGHVAFLSCSDPRFWAAAQAVRFFDGCLDGKVPGSPCARRAAD